jgi:hypothetical protein
MNTKGLGYRQRHMLNFMKKYVTQYGDNERLFSIARDEKKTALCLENRGLVRIVNKNWECWQIKLA